MLRTGDRKRLVPVWLHMMSVRKTEKNFGVKMMISV
jgi:hypothetical protein